MALPKSTNPPNSISNIKQNVNVNNFEVNSITYYNILEDYIFFFNVNCGLDEKY